jgi:hypothetical protein
VTEGLKVSFRQLPLISKKKIEHTSENLHRQLPSKKGIKIFSAKYWPNFHGALKHRSFPTKKVTDKACY